LTTRVHEASGWRSLCWNSSAFGGAAKPSTSETSSWNPLKAFCAIGPSGRVKFPRTESPRDLLASFPRVGRQHRLLGSHGSRQQGRKNAGVLQLLLRQGRDPGAPRPQWHRSDRCPWLSAAGTRREEHSRVPRPTATNATRPAASNSAATAMLDRQLRVLGLVVARCLRSTKIDGRSILLPLAMKRESSACSRASRPPWDGAGTGRGLDENFATACTHGRRIRPS
jgi:hypothetical protein